MAQIVPTINATTPEDYAQRIDRVQPFARRLHIDVSDGKFDPTKTVGLNRIYDIEGVPFDLHLMETHPESQLEHIVSLHPQLVIVHFETEIDRPAFYQQMHDHGIRVGLALCHDTTVEEAKSELLLVDHLLIFTGTLGQNHGQFHRGCLKKIGQAREINPELEISVDGGVDEEAALLAIDAGADVLDCGSVIHDARDPQAVYEALSRLGGGEG